MKDYQIWGFVYLNFGSKNINTITGNKEEADVEFEIPCFDGIAYYKAQGRCYVAHYPKYADLTDEQRARIKQYGGYEPERGEFGVIMGALGDIQRVSAREYNLIAAAHPVSAEDKKRLEF